MLPFSATGANGNSPVFQISNTANGAVAISASSTGLGSNGVFGFGNNGGWGVAGLGNNGCNGCSFGGVYGSSNNGGYGVKGQSDAGVGGQFISSSGFSLIASSTGVGTAFLAQGPSVFAGNVSLQNAGTGITFPDGTTQTSAASPGIAQYSVSNQDFSFVVSQSNTYALTCQNGLRVITGGGQFTNGAAGTVVTNTPNPQGTGWIIVANSAPLGSTQALPGSASGTFHVTMICAAVSSTGG